MIIQCCYLDKYDWLVKVFYEVHPEDTNIILKELLIILAVILLVLGIISIVKKSKNYATNTETEIKLETVKDYSTFFTVENCINKYINALSNSNGEDAFNLLTNEYKNLKSINKDNVDEKLDYLDGNYVYEARNIFEKNIDNNIKEYYIYGLLKEDVLGGYDTGKDSYYQVIIEDESYTFTLRPYTIEEYRKAIQ